MELILLLFVNLSDKYSIWLSKIIHASTLLPLDQYMVYIRYIDISLITRQKYILCINKTFLDMFVEYFDEYVFVSSACVNSVNYLSVWSNLNECSTPWIDIRLLLHPKSDLNIFYFCCTDDQVCYFFSFIKILQIYLKLAAIIMHNSSMNISLFLYN